MEKQIKKTIWSVILGVSLISVITAFLSLFINMLSFTAYKAFQFAPFDDSHFEIFRKIYIISSIIGTLFIIAITLKFIFAKKIGFNRVMFLICLLLIISAAIITVYVVIRTFTLPVYPADDVFYPNSVNYNLLSVYLNALASVLQFSVSAIFMFVSQHILSRPQKDNSQINSNE